MPIASHATRVLVAACLAVATWLSVMPVSAGTPAALRGLEPPRPLPGYRPAFVTETDQHPWTDCLWASGAMLLDKWTNGEVTRTHQQLRKLAKDHKAGSTLVDLRAAYAKLGIDLKFSPDGGERITLKGLLRRLKAGAGAVVLGDDSKLPRWYGRWDYRFWKGKGKTDNHAVYVERYDPRHGRVWLMDPLARGNWKGEWISVRALYRFAWKSGSALYVAVTPTAKPAPFAGVKLGQGSLSATTTALTASWGLQAPRGWAFQGANVRATFSPAKDALLAAATSASVSVDTSGAKAPSAPVAAVAGKSLRATAPLPAKAGAYTATLTVTDRRFGHTVAVSAPATVFVPGARRATLRLRLPDDPVTAGGQLAVTVSAANTGDKTWADPDTPIGAATESAAPRDTRVIARWIPLDPAPATGTGAIAVPVPDVLREVPLAAGHFVNIAEEVAVPETVGHWALVIDIVDDVDGSFAAGGSAPAIAILDVLPAAGIDPIQ